jgi:hypothetical protein
MVKKPTTKKYTPNSKEKYMCAKHKKFFKEELLNWKQDIVKANNLGNLLNSSDDNVSSADIVDQASSYTVNEYFFISFMFFLCFNRKSSNWPSH